MITFLLSGLWHGASWNFVDLGGAQRAGRAAERALARGREDRATAGRPGRARVAVPAPASLGAWRARSSSPAVTWVFFRARTLPDAWPCWSASPPALDGSRPSPAAASQVRFVFCDAAPCSSRCEWTARRHWHPLQWPALPRPLRWAGYSVLLWLTLVLSREHGGAFIYFQF